MNITVVTPPPFEPVTLAEVYAHLRLDPEGSPATHDDDAMLQRQIATARAYVEQATRRALVLQTLRLSASGFAVPDNDQPSRNYAWCVPPAAGTVRIPLHRPPLVAVDSVAYYDADNALQTVSADSYYTTDDLVPELRFVASFAVPTVYTRPDALRVTYRAGYEADGSPPETQEDYAANVPQGLKDAILIGVQMLYDSVTPADLERMERMREAILQPYRVQLAT
jgi:hypothetical protein